jgi:hypothetical protein
LSRNYREENIASEDQLGHILAAAAGIAR